MLSGEKKKKSKKKKKKSKSSPTSLQFNQFNVLCHFRDKDDVCPPHSLPEEGLFQPAHRLGGGQQRPVARPDADVAGRRRPVDAADGEELSVASPPDPGARVIPRHHPLHVLATGRVGIRLFVSLLNV